MGYGKKYAEVMALAEQYRAIGENSFYLDRESDLPWDKVTSVVEGGMHRLDVSDIAFIATEGDFEFRWTIDIEEEGANGSGSYHIATARVAEMAAKLPEAARPQLRALLAKTAANVRKRADEFQSLAERQYGAAYALERLAQQ